MVHDMADYRTQRKGVTLRMGSIDLQPIILAVAALVVAATPAAISVLAAQAAAIRARVAVLEVQAQIDRQAVAAAVAGVKETVRGTAAQTQAVVKEQKANGG